jgi:hypothetical protein
MCLQGTSAEAVPTSVDRDDKNRGTNGVATLEQVSRDWSVGLVSVEVVKVTESDHFSRI